MEELSLKKLILTFLAITALGAAVASSASAAAVEASGTWYVAGVPVKEEPECSATIRSRRKNTGLSSRSSKRRRVEMQLDSMSWSAGKIYNESGKAKMKTTLKFRRSQSGETCRLFRLGWGDHVGTLGGQVYMEGTKALLRYAPATGTTFATFKLGGCSIAGTSSIKGTEFGEMANPTGVAAASQILRFSSAINSAAGGALTVGGNPVVLTEQPILMLTKGEPLAVKE
jgi:hypothetical protein